MIGQTACGRLKNVCGSSANQEKDVLTLAEVPQIKKRTFWCLRKFRKSKRGRFGACGSSANQKENVLVLAEVPQIKKRTFWRLRKFRKSKRRRFSVCGSSANQKEDVLALAEVPQIEKRTFWRLRKFRKYCFLHFDVCGRSAWSSYETTGRGISVSPHNRRIRLHRRRRLSSGGAPFRLPQ